jgi:hypothetical protein
MSDVPPENATEEQETWFWENGMFDKYTRMLHYARHRHLMELTLAKQQMRIDAAHGLVAFLLLLQRTAFLCPSRAKYRVCAFVMPAKMPQCALPRSAVPRVFAFLWESCDICSSDCMRKSAMRNLVCKCGELVMSCEDRDDWIPGAKPVCKICFCLCMVGEEVPAPAFPDQCPYCSPQDYPLCRCGACQFCTYGRIMH